MTDSPWWTDNDPDWMLSFLMDGRFPTDRLPVVVARFAERGRLAGMLNTELRQQFLDFAQWVFGLRSRPLPIPLPVYDPQGTEIDAEVSLLEAMSQRATWTDVAFIGLAEANDTRRVNSRARPTSPTADEWQRHQADDLRDILGDPSHPVEWRSSWRSETVVALATGIHFDNAFDRLPILADALEEAGCDHAEVLTHCRGPGPHARGCWVVDAARGK